MTTHSFIRYTSCPKCGESAGWVIGTCSCCDKVKFTCPDCGFQWRPDEEPVYKGHTSVVGWEMGLLRAAETGGQEAVTRELERIKREYGLNAGGPP
jgi:transposase-like protein